MSLSPIKKSTTSVRYKTKSKSTGHSVDFLYIGTSLVARYFYRILCNDKNERTRHLMKDFINHYFIFFDLFNKWIIQFLHIPLVSEMRVKSTATREWRTIYASSVALDISGGALSSAALAPSHSRQAEHERSLSRHDKRSFAIYSNIHSHI